MLMLFALPWALLCLPLLAVRLPEGRLVQQTLSFTDERPIIIPKDVCWKSLSCSLEEIEAMGMVDRAEFLRYMASAKFDLLSAGNQFHAMEGVMDFFLRKDLAGPGSWLSFINAVMVESVEQGAAAALGLPNTTQANPGSHKWAQFLNQLKKGQLNDRTAHDYAWATAEQATVNYALELAKKSPNLKPPSRREVRWLQISGRSRDLMLHRRAILWVLKMTVSFTNPAVPLLAEAVIDWATDVTDAESSSFVAEMAWRLASIDFYNDGRDVVAHSDEVVRIFWASWTAFNKKAPPAITSTIINPESVIEAAVQLWLSPTWQPSE